MARICLDYGHGGLTLGLYIKEGKKPMITWPWESSS